MVLLVININCSYLYILTMVAPSTGHIGGKTVVRCGEVVPFLFRNIFIFLRKIFTSPLLKVTKPSIN